MSLGPIRVVKQSNKLRSASVIFLHGSGDSGRGILEWVKSLVGDFSMPHIDFYFPTAPVRKYTAIQGEASNVWFDRYEVTPEVPEHTETLESIGVEIKKFMNTIVESGVPLNRIVIGGFSMGGALALHTAYRFNPGVAGVFALSSFLNNNSVLLKEAKALETPLYMCHGDRDTIVHMSWGKKTYEELTKLGIKGTFIPVKSTLHELRQSEIEGLFEWIQKILPALESDE